MRTPELLAPAGDLGKLKIAVDYGADAVYIGGGGFGLRAAAENFSTDELAEGIDYAHANGSRVYVTCNIYAKNSHVRRFPEFVKMLRDIRADAVIVSDMGIFSAARECCPEMEVHISTQANTLNYEACRFYHKLGAKRVVLGREVTLEEIREIRQNIPDELELEAFVHGAMCISYSGRCLLSGIMAERSANLGNCAHSCRWKYSIVEEKRPGEYMPVFEDESGTYIMNSKDMCMIEHLAEIYEAGVSSFKIEGRAKSEFYVASTVNAYRKALDLTVGKKPFESYLLDEVKKVSHRDYFTGFYFGLPEGTKDRQLGHNSYIRECDIVGIVRSYDAETETAVITAKNKFRIGDEAEALIPRGDIIRFRINEIIDSEGNRIEVSNRPEAAVSVKMPECRPGTVIRKEKQC